MFRELLPLYLAGLMVFVVLRTTDVLSVLASTFLQLRPAPGDLALVFGALVPSFFELSLVVAVPFAALLLLGRMAKDSETKALLALGVSPLRLIGPVALLGLLVSLLGLFNSSRLVPQGYAAYWGLFYERIFNTAEPTPSTNDYVHRQGDTLFYASRVQTLGGGRAELLGVMVSRPGQVYTAPYGTWDARAATWELSNPVLTEAGAAPRALQRPLSLPQRDRLRPPAPSGDDLLRVSGAELRALAAAPDTPPAAQRELTLTLYRRHSDPFAALGLALAAGAIGLLIPGRVWAFAALIALVFGFYVVWTLTPELVRAGALSPALGAALPLLLLGLLAAALLRRAA